jgi:hypothetical protein
MFRNAQIPSFIAVRRSAPTLAFNPSSLPANVQKFWQDQIQPLAPGGAYTLSGCTGGAALPTTNPVVFAFDVFCGTSFNDSLALYNLDYNGIPDFNNPNQLYFTSGGQYSYYAPQFSSLFAWRSVAWSQYNALQATLRHRMSHGFQFDLNYTLSKATDISSDAERIGPASNGSLLGEQQHHQCLGFQCTKGRGFLRCHPPNQCQLDPGASLRTRTGVWKRFQSTPGCADRWLAAFRVAPLD